MYVRVLQDELQFPDDRAIDQDTKSFIQGVSSRLRLFFSLGKKLTRRVAPATESGAEDLRAEDKTASVLFYDVRSPSYFFLLARR
jgi:hypothetical protein